MLEGKFNIKRLIAKAAFVGEVHLRLLEKNDKSPPKISFNPEIFHDGYNLFVSFGILYAWEHVPDKLQRYDVVVDYVRGHAVDSTAVIMAYVSANAFWDALKFVPNNVIKIDEEGCGLFFPR